MRCTLRFVGFAQGFAQGLILGPIRQLAAYGRHEGKGQAGDGQALSSYYRRCDGSAYSRNKVSGTGGNALVFHPSVPQAPARARGKIVVDDQQN